MSKRKTTRMERHIRIRSVRKDSPDLRKLARAIIDLAIAQAEADAAKQAEQVTTASDNQPTTGDAA